MVQRLADKLVTESKLVGVSVGPPELRAIVELLILTTPAEALSDPRMWKNIAILGKSIDIKGGSQAALSGISGVSC